jgi:glycerol-3-phosphate cytidylyltransferase-like family protein
MVSYVKAQMGRPIDEVPLEDPLRIQFNNLHEYSVWILVTGMIAALTAFLSLRASRKKHRRRPIRRVAGFQVLVQTIENK